MGYQARIASGANVEYPPSRSPPTESLIIYDPPSPNEDDCLIDENYSMETYL
jgi:hypothetical protein